MGAISSIGKILYKALEDGNLSMPIAFEGLDFDPAGEEAYLACYILRAPTLQAELGSVGCDAHTGIFQVDINYREGIGATLALNKADEVNFLFKSGASFTDSVEVVKIRNVSASRLNLVGGWATINLSIEYITYSQRI